MDGPQAPSADPAPIRAGDPAALEAFCASRGPAVLAFAATVLPAELAVSGAAEALARFRAALAALEGMPVDQERLLRGATRRAVAAACPPTPGSRRARATCAHVPELLATRLEGGLPPEDARHLERHLARCEGCRELAARFDAAEQAYDAPPAGPLPPEAAAALVGALAAAGPGAPAVGPAPPPPPAAAASPPAEPARPSGPALPAGLAPPAGSAAPPDPGGRTEELPVVPAPRPPGPPAYARPRRHRPAVGDHGLVRTVLLPLAVVGAAAVAAMGIAGVFDDPAPEPAATTPPITQPVQTIAPATPRRSRTTPAPAGGGGGLGVPGPGSPPRAPDAVAAGG